MSPVPGDDGPPANEFLHDDYDDDNASLGGSDDEPLSEHIRKVTQAWREPNVEAGRKGDGNSSGNGEERVMDLRTLRDVQGGFASGNQTSS
ncbi:hypothetical protein CVT24_010199 [Panaeolus cyanescens]|uniref:Uncharacterized protein n=1 Tax=Panaeolus cyanescens TaxID=181874 RepID=A0A409YPX5_9AGAR|nr:hypothetical protein CVT24_010199 [Panaeolus cyanescens]